MTLHKKIPGLRFNVSRALFVLLVIFYALYIATTLPFPEKVGPGPTKPATSSALPGGCSHQCITRTCHRGILWHPLGTGRVWWSRILLGFIIGFKRCWRLLRLLWCLSSLSWWPVLYANHFWTSNVCRCCWQLRREARYHGLLLGAEVADFMAAWN